MPRSLNTAVTGLKVNQTKMDVIGHNIANVNTTAFKANRVTFSELFTQTQQAALEPTGNRGGINPKQIGLGAQVAAVDVIHTQGAITATGKNTDAAVQGNGFFVVKDERGGRAYTRDGNFSLDADHNLTTTDGLIVQGWAADKEGNVNTNGPIDNLEVDLDRTLPAKSTSRLDLAGNLFRPTVLKESDAFVNHQGNGVGINDPAVVPTTFVAGANAIFDAGELTINNVSIVGALPFTAATESSQVVMQKIADLINFHKDKTNVVATVKTAPSAGGTASDAQVVLTSLQPGRDAQITIGGAGIPVVNGTALFTAGTTTIETFTPTTAAGRAAQAEDASITFGSGAIIVNGVDIGPLAATSATNTSEQNAQAIVSLINAKKDVTGVTAFTDGNGRISMRATARDIILSGSDVQQDSVNTAIPAVTVGAVARAPADGVSVTALSGLHLGMNASRNATTLVGTTTEVFDALGTRHKVAMDFVADYDAIFSTTQPGGAALPSGGSVVLGTRDKGSWEWAASSTEQGVAVNSSNGDVNNLRFDPRVVNFNSKGLLQDFTGQFTLNFFNGDATILPPSSIFDFNTNFSANVEQPQPVSVDVGTVSDTDGLTQFDAPNTLFVADQNGFTSGNLVSFNFTSDGTIQGVFSNGKFRSLGKMALASFSNEAGLSRGLFQSSGGNVYQESSNSGLARIGEAKTRGFGSIVGASLESSNIDLADQFTDMIITQRGFQANARTITTSDEMLQEVISLKR